jgi:ankyrin repeat protein
MPRTVDMEDIENDPLATATDIFKFETAANLLRPTTIELCGENIVPYDLDDALKVLVQHNGVAPMTRAKFGVEDIEPLCVVQRPKEAYLDTLDQLLVANLQLGSPSTCWRVRGLLTAKANPNTRKGVVSPMQLAIKHNNVPALYALLHAGADDNIRHSKLETAMRCAVKGGNPDMVRSVAMLGAHQEQEPDLIDLAARAGRVDVLEVLVNELGYELHQHIMSAHRAIEKGHCNVVDFFFRNDGTLATKRYRDGRNALTIAAAAGQTAVIDLLVKNYGMQPYDMDALCAAARHDRPASLRKLASLIADKQWMETPDREDETPIMAALRNGAYVSVLTLAEMGCQPFDALFEMARLNNSEALSELLTVIIDKQGRVQEVVDARRTSEDGVAHTLLSWAAVHGSFNCALEVMRRVEALKKMHVV